MKVVQDDIFYMRQALRLASKGRGRTNPNPLVGSILVKNGRVCATGYHQRAGGPHAEIIALRQAGPRARGATLYTTLEPCCHTKKKTPPCVPALIDAGLHRIVVAMKDPNPEVAGRGIHLLKQAGLMIDVGCMEPEAARLNQVYLHWIRTGRPFVTLKAAMTLDGKIATDGGESKWITGIRARQQVHRLRSQVDALIVGSGTVIKDDPELSARPGSQAYRTPIGCSSAPVWTETQGKLKERAGQRFSRQPVRVILDSRLRLPLSARVFKWMVEQPTIVATTAQAPSHRVATFRGRGVVVWVLPSFQGRVSLRACLTKIGQMGLSHVMVEGGSTVNAGFFQVNLVNQVLLFIAPRLMGGQNAISVIGNPGQPTLAKAWPLQNLTIQRLGQDFLVKGTLPSPID